MQLYIPSKKERLKNAFVRAILLKKEKEKSVGIGMENMNLPVGVHAQMFGDDIHA
jgi:hypothetical protein